MSNTLLEKPASRHLEDCKQVFNAKYSRPPRRGVSSAWYGHVPFALWLVQELKPDVVVELGTHNGVSFAAFCEGVVQAGLPSRCYAVDTWKGDEHAGAYGEDVFNSLSAFLEPRYGSFAELLRCTFDEALPSFADNSISLLHIDGFHTYEAVRHDFESWRPKLAPDAIVLFHDTNVRGGDFGVWRFWHELVDQHPGFEFVHEHGLGVLALGDRLPPAVRLLCGGLDRDATAYVRSTFAGPGAACAMDARLEATIAEGGELRGEIARLNGEIGQLRARVAAGEQDLGAARGERDGLAGQLALGQAFSRRVQALLAPSRPGVLEAGGDLAELAGHLQAALQQGRVAAEKADSAQRLATQGSESLKEARLVAEHLRAELNQARASAEGVRSQAQSEIRALQGVCGDMRTQCLVSQRQLQAAETRLRLLRGRMTLLSHSAGWKALQVANRVDRILPVIYRVLRAVWWTTQGRYRHSKEVLLQREAPFALSRQHDRQLAQEILESGAFDAQWYATQYPDVPTSGLTPAEHYVLLGWLEGKSPNRDFKADAYYAVDPAAAERAVDPFLAWIRAGKPELPSVAAPNEVGPIPAEDHGTQAYPAATIPDETPSSQKQLRLHHPALVPLRVLMDGRVPETVSIVTDGLDSGRLFGGVGTALILGTLISNRLDRQLRIITRAGQSDPGAYGDVLRANGVKVRHNPEFVYAPLDGSRSTVLNPRDLVITTSWWTTRSLLGAIQAARILYLLQEDERMFYAQGDMRLRCSEVLQDEAVRLLVNTEELYTHLAAGADPLPGMATRAAWFRPAFPHQPTPGWDRQGRKRFFFYARPGNERNLFWRGVEVIDRAVTDGTLDPGDWDIFFVGGRTPPMRLGGAVTPVNIEQMSWPDYVAFIGSVDLGLSLMDTPHPSYPPLDLAAAGAVVVTTRHGIKQSLQQWSDNIICAPASTAGLAAALRDGATLAQDIPRRRTNWENNRIARDWEAAAGPVLDTVLEHFR